MSDATLCNVCVSWRRQTIQRWSKANERGERSSINGNANERSAMPDLGALKGAEAYKTAHTWLHFVNSQSREPLLHHSKLGSGNLEFASAGSHFLWTMGMR